MKHPALDLLPSLNRTADESQQRSSVQCSKTGQEGQVICKVCKMEEMKDISKILSRNTCGLFTQNIPNHTVLM
jgi:ribosomal protein S28E/S33